MTQFFFGYFKNISVYDRKKNRPQHTDTALIRLVLTHFTLLSRLSSANPFPQAHVHLKG